jgi:ATP-binding cassette subfamily B protein
MATEDVPKVEGRADTSGSAGKQRPAQSLRPLAGLGPLINAHRGDAAAAALALMVSTGSTLGLTAALRLVVDKGFETASRAGLNATFVILLGVAILLAVATAARFYFITRLGERVAADLRVALYGRALTLDQATFLEVRPGEVLSRLTVDVGLVEAMVGSGAAVALRNLLTLFGALTMLVFVSARLTLFVIALAPFVLAPLVLYGRHVRRLSVRAQERLGEAVVFAGETLEAVDTVQAFGGQGRLAGRFAQAVDAAFSASLARVRARAFMTGGVIALVFGGVAAVFWLGANAVIDGRMSAGALVQFATLAVLTAGAAGALSEVWGEVQKAAGAMDRINSVLEASPAIAAPQTPTPLPQPPQGQIDFEDVAFAYPGRPDLPALNGFTLHVRPGERVALVGPSGAGKSTVFRLLLRFFDPTSGAVRIDGVTLRDADVEAVRGRIAWVAQDAPLFSGSAAENIGFGRPEAGRGEILGAVKAAQAAAFLAALPEGLDTPLGEKAKTLSGGERQRLAIARALIRNAAILLLDEATSALDAENELLIQRALGEAMRGRTTLVIAHRLATVLSADRIVVMDHGRIVEEGTHTELVARGGVYARLAELQFGMEAA